MEKTYAMSRRRKAREGSVLENLVATDHFYKVEPEVSCNTICCHCHCTEVDWVYKCASMRGSEHLPRTQEGEITSKRLKAVFCALLIAQQGCRTAFQGLTSTKGAAQAM